MSFAALEALKWLTYPETKAISLGDSFRFSITSRVEGSTPEIEAEERGGTVLLFPGFVSVSCGSGYFLGLPRFLGGVVGVTGSTTSSVCSEVLVFLVGLVFAFRVLGLLGGFFLVKLKVIFLLWVFLCSGGTPSGLRSRALGSSSKGYHLQLVRNWRLGPTPIPGPTPT